MRSCTRACGSAVSHATRSNVRFSPHPVVLALPGTEQRRLFAQKAAAGTERPALEMVRNVAIIAHVDHGKTTLVDQLMKQSGMGLKVSERMLDSKDLEQERGITILSKATRIMWNGYLFNIVDTPGHADFGGEVERVLSMVDGVVLLVDCLEGPKTQTKFVLQKALQHKGMVPLVVVNKVDRPDAREPGEVENEIFDMFVMMCSDDSQLEYPTLYASGKQGWCTKTMEEARSEAKPTNMNALYEMIRDCVPPPKAELQEQAVLDADEKCQGFSMLVSQMDQLAGGLGPTVTGKVFSGRLQKGDKIFAKNLEGEVVASGKARDITVVQGITREPIGQAQVGDIVAVSVSGFIPKWTQTLVSHAKVPHIVCQPIDPPVISVRLSVNNSPLAGKDGKYITLHSVGERLEKESITNPAIETTMSPQKDYFEIRGRGEMQLGILIEEMRREGYEMSLSAPQVVKALDESGILVEPWQEIQIEVDNEHSGMVVERMASRGANVVEILSAADRQVMKFDCSTSAFLGMRNWLREATGGSAVIFEEFKDMRPAAPPLPRTRNGVLVVGIASISDTAWAVDLAKAQRLGKLFIGEGCKVYPGMIFGETRDMDDIDTSLSRPQNIGERVVEGAGKLIPASEKTLEQALSYILDDEQVEVTPQRIVMRKKVLELGERKKAARLSGNDSRFK